MVQQTLQLSDDCKLVAEILKNRNVSEKVGLFYEGNSRHRFEHHAKRSFNNAGNPLIHAQEIYRSQKYGLSEQRTYAALNELVRQKKADTYFCEGLLWYAWTA